MCIGLGNLKSSKGSKKVWRNIDDDDDDYIFERK
jgi:hypothetical protein